MVNGIVIVAELPLVAGALRARGAGIGASRPTAGLTRVSRGGRPLLTVFNNSRTTSARTA
jgi:hypothetical protein